MKEEHPLEEKIREIDYIFDVSRVLNTFSGDVIGFNVSASSLIRKSYTLERIKSYVEENKLPLEVDDCWGEGYVAFRLMIKP